MISSKVLAINQRVAIVVKPNSSFRRCFIGRVSAKDEFGIRLVLWDSVDRLFNGNAIVIPHRNIDSVLADEYPCEPATEFIRYADNWQRTIDKDFISHRNHLNLIEKIR